MISMTSCNLNDFQLNKFAKITELSPMIYRPFTTGVYPAKDYATFPETAFMPVLEDSLVYKPISYPLNGMTFNTTGTDSMVVIIKTINETPMKYRYSLSFNGTILDSRTKSKFLNAAAINSQGDVMSTSADSLEYFLKPADVKNLGAATQIDMAITLYQPDKGTVVAHVLKTSQITFKIGFRAPLNLLNVRL